MSTQAKRLPSAPDLSVTIGGVRLAHPLLNASGTFDARETLARYGADALRPFPFAAYVPKTVTLEPRAGNAPPRVTETACGMINAVGLANRGLEAYLEDLSLLTFVGVPVIVNVGGRSPSDYVEVVRRVEEFYGERASDAGRATTVPHGVGDLPNVVGYELNVSCPNVEQGGASLGADAAETARLVEAIRPLTRGLLVVKLTPNVTDVVAVARAAADAGADALSLINTLKALVVDPKTLRPFLGNRTGGLCGPAIKPVALRMVWEVAQAVDLPLIGMGGIVSGLDALEFIACGATAVAVGAANFLGLDQPVQILAQLTAELSARGAVAVSEVRGRALPPNV